MEQRILSGAFISVIFFFFFGAPQAPDAVGFGWFIG
jgi:hypothetical protein